MENEADIVALYEKSLELSNSLLNLAYTYGTYLKFR